jgi:hypothetical protein
MSSGGFELSIGDALPYLEEKFLKIIGKDAATLEEQQWLRSLHLTALNLTKSVQCIGMKEPIPFERIYQHTRFRDPSLKRPPFLANEESIADPRSYTFSSRKDDSPQAEIDKFIKSKRDAIVFAGPGWGKTIFMHYIFRRFRYDETVMPILITLRRPTAVADLERFVSLSSKTKKRPDKIRIVLIVDGYDELKVSERKRVSEALLTFQSLAIGTFYLSCRDYYEVFDLRASEYSLDRFSRTDKVSFVKAFLSAIDSKLDPSEVMGDFEARSLGHFLSHPLLLALACLVRASSRSLQPRSTLRLLERALEVLSIRWDDQRGIDRESHTPLDGRDRIQILKRIAYATKSPYLPETRVFELAHNELKFLTFDGVDPRQVLLETAQFYGILVPSDDGWEFVHRSLQDYLAAQYSVETGEFARITNHEWTARTAYAACLMHDSLPILEAALASDDGMPTVTEILSNFPSFDLSRAASAIVGYFSVQRRTMILEMPSEGRVRGSLHHEFIRAANTMFLNRLIEYCCVERNPTKDIICGYCLLELASRGARLDPSLYELAKSAYGSENFTFYLMSSGFISLSSVGPNSN